MSVADIIIIIVVVLLLGGIFFYLLRRNKKSCHTCSYAKSCQAYCPVIKETDEKK
ncbi:MAG: Virus attachment protein p12 family protein [Tenericutes bacterium ADurb.Bin087]|nr:MAG: Virus attachment protein p12 family protein [Tenericutes bacterium ADurb.Bin087]